MSIALQALAVVGCIAIYIALGGVVYEISTRIKPSSENAAQVVAIFWPLSLIIGAVYGICWIAGQLGTWGGTRIVAGIEVMTEWRREPRIPRATARRKGGRP